MKRLLSALLTLALVMSLIPAVFADGTTPAEQVYDFGDGVTGHTQFFRDETSDKGLDGFEKFRTIKDNEYYVNSTYISDKNNWKLFDVSNDIIEKTVNATQFGLFFVKNSDSYLTANGSDKNMNIDIEFALSLKAQETGFFIPQLYFYNGSYNKSPKLDWYITDADATDYKDSGNKVLNVSTMDAAIETRQADKVIYTQSGNELVTAFAGEKQNYRFYDITLTEVQNPKIEITVDKTELNTTDNTTALVTSTTVKGDNQTTAMPVAGGFIEYVVEQEGEFITFDEATGTITAVAAGEAHITAQSPDGLVKSNEITVTVTAPSAEPEDPAAEGTVSFAQTTNIDGFTGIAVESVARGEAVELTAHKQTIDGYKFIGWKRGADTSDENAWVDITGDTYRVWTNTYLTAIYEKETDVTEKAVEFWNQNGAYLGKSTEASYKEDVKRVPKLVGFGTFLGWFTDGNIKLTADTELKTGTTNAVAQYEDGTVTGVTYKGVAINGSNSYNAPIELNKTNANTAWLRDGEPVAYGTTYNFNVWDATNITEGTEEITNKVPVAILDYSATHEAYMLEYDAGDYDIVEAGIIFGKDTASIKTYTSQRKETHNQFTVPEEDGLDATGYIIYTLDDGASYKTKYVSVKTEE